MRDPDCLDLHDRRGRELPAVEGEIDVHLGKRAPLLDPRVGDVGRLAAAPPQVEERDVSAAGANGEIAVLRSHFEELVRGPHGAARARQLVSQRRGSETVPGVDRIRDHDETVPVRPFTGSREGFGGIGVGVRENEARTVGPLPGPCVVTDVGQTAGEAVLGAVSLPRRAGRLADGAGTPVRALQFAQLAGREPAWKADPDFLDKRDPAKAADELERRAADLTARGIPLGEAIAMIAKSIRYAMEMWSAQPPADMETTGHALSEICIDIRAESGAGGGHDGVGGRAGSEAGEGDAMTPPYGPALLAWAAWAAAHPDRLPLDEHGEVVPTVSAIAHVERTYLGVGEVQRWRLAQCQTMREAWLTTTRLH